jgi:catechol 2,3-dioxygenase-like lactoylglutathione lyase family enzyme
MSPAENASRYRRVHDQPPKKESLNIVDDRLAPDATSDVIVRMQRLSIPVSDQDRAKCFYVQMLGMELINDVLLPMTESIRWLEVAPCHGGTTLLLVDRSTRMRPGALDGVMFGAVDLDAYCDRLRTMGVAVDGPQETPWGRQASIRDPDGNELLFVESDPVGPYHRNWLAWRYASRLPEP